MKLAVQCVRPGDLPIGLFDLGNQVDDFAENLVENNDRIVLHRAGYGGDGAGGAPSSLNVSSST